MIIGWGYDVLVCRWNDNSDFPVATNFENLDIVTAKRWSHEKKKLKYQCLNRHLYVIITSTWENWTNVTRLLQFYDRECGLGKVVAPICLFLRHFVVNTWFWPEKTVARKTLSPYSLLGIL